MTTICFKDVDKCLPKPFVHPGTQHFLLDMININYHKTGQRVLSQAQNSQDFDHLKHKIDTAEGAEAQLNGLRWIKH